MNEYLIDYKQVMDKLFYLIANEAIDKTMKYYKGNVKIEDSETLNLQLSDSFNIVIEKVNPYLYGINIKYFFDAITIVEME